MGTTAHIQVKVDASGNEEDRPLAGSELKILGRIYDPNTHTALTDWVPIPCTQITVQCEGVESLVTVDLRVRPTSIAMLAGYLGNVELDTMDPQWLYELEENRRAQRPQVSD